MKWIILLASILACGCGESARPPHGQLRPAIAVAESTGSLRVRLDSPAQSIERPALFVSELSAGEGILEFRTSAPSLPLRAEPSLAAKVIDSLQSPVGASIQYDEERYQTMRAGLIAILAPIHVTGRNLGPIRYLSRDAYYSAAFPDDTLALPAGTTADYLMWRAEGTCFIRVGGNVIDAHYCPVGFTRYPDDGTGPAAQLIHDSEVEWWIRVTLNGEPRGWALVDERTMQVERRE
jgi:hypothetical protein